jgi:hypothetical protein
VQPLGWTISRFTSVNAHFDNTEVTAPPKLVARDFVPRGFSSHRRYFARRESRPREEKHPSHPDFPTSHLTRPATGTEATTRGGRPPQPSSENPKSVTVSETLTVELIVGKPTSRRIFANRLNPFNRQTLFHNSSVTQSTHIANLGARLCDHLRKGCLMRRSTLLLFTGLMLVCFSGCHFHWWHRKHHKNFEYAGYDACGCGCDGGYVGSSLDPGPAPIPLTHIVSSSSSALPGVASGSIQSAPGVATPAPAGTKLSSPANK